MKLLLIILFLASPFLATSQTCIVESMVQRTSGSCTPVSSDSCKLNFFTEPDYVSPLYNFYENNVTGYSVAQKFGRTGNVNGDMESLNCKVFTPINNFKHPVILLSPLSGFTSSNIYGNLMTYIATYYAKRGFVVILYKSRTFRILADPLNPPPLTDFITNSHYVSDSMVLADYHNKITSSSAQYVVYTFFDLLESLSKANNGQQLVFDAYLEMLYKISNDTRHLMKLVQDNKHIYNMSPFNIFLMGGSAGAVQSLHAGLLNDPSSLQPHLDSLVLNYQGVNGDLKSDFPFEPIVADTLEAKGILNLWGFLSSLEMINNESPAIFSAHGTWDDVFSFQHTFQEDMQLYFGFGAEAIFHKASQAGIHTDMFTVCKGKHALFPAYNNSSCKFVSQDEADLFHDLLRKANTFMQQCGRPVPANDIYAVSSPSNYSPSPPPLSLVTSGCVYTDSNDHCPVIYPDHFAVQYIEEQTLNLQALSQGSAKIDQEFSDKFSLHPNPTNGNIDLTIFTDKSKAIEISISDLNGKTIKSLSKKIMLSEGKNEMKITLDHLNAGIYFITFKSGSVILETRKVILIN